MALFGKKAEGGMMDVIRCDEADYLVWKWRPAGQQANTTSKENSIRWGSSLRVKDGEVAVFVYKQKDGTAQDFIEGPFDETIRTANFPVLAGIIGMAYAGQSPFQAEVYFINLAGNVRQEFGVPMFDVADPRFGDITVRVAARGSLVFKIEDYRGFIKLHRLVQFDLAQFKLLVRDAVIKYVKSAIANAPIDHGIQVVQIERKLLEINNLIEPGIRSAFEANFGVKLVRFDLAAIEIDKDDDYDRLRSITSDIQIAMLQKQNAVNMRNLDDTQDINAENMRETLAINRNAAEEFQRLQTQTNFIQAHQINQQADVLKTAAASLGAMGNMNVGSGGSHGAGGGFNPVGVMTGLAVGGAMGSQMANMTNAAGQAFQQPQVMPPPVPQVQYNVSIDGRSAGPFTLAQLKDMARSGQLRRDSMVWKAGMQAWAAASTVDELAGMFVSEPPPLGPYHAAVGGQNQGPFDYAQIRAMIGDGRLRPDSMVWRSGLEQWQAAQLVPELAPLFAAPAGPPPVPPGAGMPPPPPGAA